MYIPPHFREERLEVLHDLVRKNSLGTLVTLTSDGLVANHLPMLLESTDGAFGTLRGHLSRSNAQWSNADPAVEALVIFQGPAAYISPSWYATKQETGKVVPTYNFVTVHAYGPLKTFDEPDTLREHLRALTAFHEAELPEPWSIDDAPEDYIRGLLNGIVGVEIAISRIEGKWKVSQNRPAKDRVPVAENLLASEAQEKRAMGQLVKERST